MKKLLLCLLGTALVASAAFAGVDYSGKEIKQVAPPPCPEWYADREFNVSLWGTYAFTGRNWIDDRYIEADHAWGGGLGFATDTGPRVRLSYENRYVNVHGHRM